jgi:glycosyltransferase involved in cell wall biosynthesis
MLRKYNIDIVIAGFFSQLQTLAKCGIPILYWEQGSENLYGDWGTVQASNSPQLERIRKIYHLPIAIASVSPFVSSVLKAKYGRITPLLYAGIDTEFYRPMNSRCEKPPHAQTNILLVGNPALAFKGFNLILAVLNKLWNDGYQFQVTWASQISLKITADFPIRILSNLSQTALAELYRTSDILISGSVYESFPMPPMEAFASGTAVVSTDNGGIHAYAKPGENILLAEQGNFADLYAAVEFMLNNPEARRQIALNARKDALQFSISHSIDQLENILYHLVSS